MGAMKRSQPINKTNQKRRLKVEVTVWGPPGYREHVRAQPCAVRGCCSGSPVEPHHEPHKYPQGRGTWRDLVPLCGFHHTKGGAAVHRLGRDSFAERFGVDYEAVKAEVLALWKKGL